MGKPRPREKSQSAEKYDYKEQLDIWQLEKKYDQRFSRNKHRLSEFANPK